MTERVEPTPRVISEAARHHGNGSLFYLFERHVEPGGAFGPVWVRHQVTAGLPAYDIEDVVWDAVFEATETGRP